MRILDRGNYLEVHPTFLYEMLVTITIFAILLIKKDKRKFTGEFTYIYLIIYGLGRMVIEGMRTDSLMLGPVRISQILSGVLFAVFLVLYIKNRVQKEK